MPSIGDAERGQGRASTFVGRESSISGKCSIVGVGVALLRRECRLTCLTTSITLMDLIFLKIRMERRERGRIPFEMEEGN